MSSPSKSECELKAGHPPAGKWFYSFVSHFIVTPFLLFPVKAGGMRITQHKTHRETGGLSEDTTGLKVSGSPPKAVTISGAVAKGNADFPAEAVQAFHKEKPPVQHAIKPVVNIQQPRK